jgi:hypothetical protein
MEIARHWRLRRQRYRLEGSICLNCGQVSFPPRLACPPAITQPPSIAALAASEVMAARAIPGIEAHMRHPVMEAAVG